MTVDLQRDVEITWRDRRGTVLDLSLIEGHWTAEQYLLLSGRTNQLIEFTDGELEVLPMPTDSHQALVEFLFLALRAILERVGGKVRFAPLRVEVRPKKFREPDIVALLDANDPRRQNAYWLGADLVVEVVSADNPERDTEQKPRDYAEAAIPEYWIVNPLDETITVLTLVEGAYIAHGIFRRGQEADSPLLADLRVSVAALFDAR